MALYPNAPMYQPYQAYQDRITQMNQYQPAPQPLATPAPANN